MAPVKAFLSAFLAALVAAAPASDASPKALYFLVNDPAGSQLAAVPVSGDGSLSRPTLTSTGGKGVLERNATDGTALGPDGLTGQGSVHVSGQYIFTVNAGSNTVSMLKIDPRDPLNPKLVGKPADTLGETPTSVTYSKQLKTACVLNGGAKNGVTCFSVCDDGLQALDKEPRTLSPYLKQTTPPRGPPGTASQISFSPDSRYLMADIKGDFASMPGTFFVWPVENNKVSEKAVTTRIKDMNANFGFAFITPDKVAVSDATYGGSVLSVGPDHHLTELSHLAGDYPASCWASYSHELDRAYFMPAGKPVFATVDGRTNQLLKDVAYDPKLMGSFDATIKGKKIYFLSGIAAVGVVDLESGHTDQSLDLSKDFPDRKYWQGIAMYKA